MKERPILFTPENAQKVFDRSKSQTRRIVKPQPHEDGFRVGIYTPTRIDREGEAYPGKACFGIWSEDWDIPCPFGGVGDRLWVRESWCQDSRGAPMMNGEDCVFYKGAHPPGTWPSYWKPSLHMPRWACRTVLEITEIRVQRLQDISEEDAKAEGIEYHNGLAVGHSGYRHVQAHEYVYATATEAFKVLWESINGAESWKLNPWVWALTFKRI